MKKITTLFPLFCIFFISLTDSLQAQNIGINTDGSVAETGVMLDVKIPTPKATTSAAATFFQLKSSDADANALKLRMGFKTDATQTNRYGFIEFPDFASGTPTYLNLSLQPSGGNVGIGTTAPNAKLTVVQSTNGYANGTLIYGNAVGGQYLALAVPAAAQALIQSGNTVSWQALLLNPNGGNVGIGTTNPTSKLHVYGNTGVDIRLEDAAVANAAWRILPQTGNTTKLFRIYDATAALDRMVIDASGNVGIGTTTPGALLEIKGAGGVSGVTPAMLLLTSTTDCPGIVLNTTAAGSPRSVLTFQKQGVGDFSITNWTGAHKFVIWDNFTGLQSISIFNGQTTIGDPGGSTPQSQFNVVGNASIGSTYYDNPAPTNGLLVEGSVAIGTTTPRGIFHIENGNARISTYDIDQPWPTANRPAWAFGSSGPSFVIQSTLDYAVYTNRMLIDYLGNVTVGSLAGTGTALVQADANGTLSRVAGGLPGNIVLLYNNETSVSGFTYANTTAFTYNVVGTFSQVKVEADIESDCSGGATVGLQGWNYSIVYNGVTKRTAQLWCHDTNTIEGIDRNNDWLSGHVSYMGAVANGQTVKIDVINTGTAGTWYVRNFRVYGVY